MLGRRLRRVGFITPTEERAADLMTPLGLGEDSRGYVDQDQAQ